MCSFLLGIASGNIQVIRPAVSSSTSSSANDTEMSFMYMFEASVKGVGQFMFVDTAVGGALVIVGIAISSRKGISRLFIFYSLECSRYMNL